jgi:hypothetical protein
MNKLHYLVLALFFILTSCNTDEDEPKNTKLTILFSNTVNSEPLVLNSRRYINIEGEEFTIERLKYYISNIKLRNKKTGEYYMEPESYHLITPDQKTADIAIELLVPEAEYDQLTFGVGVDETKNTSLSYDGDLDPNNSMAWDWESGYKFFVLEGKYYSTKTGSNGDGLVFHVGENKNYKTIALPLHDRSVKGDTITIDVAVEQMWKTPNPISFDELNEAMFGANASKIADNYSEGMFSIKDKN